MRTNGRVNTQPATSTVGRGRSIVLPESPVPSEWHNELVSLSLGDSIDYYGRWPEPIVIVSDGGYGVLGFEGDTSDHIDLPDWYEPHIAEWSSRATPQTTLWFWNSEIGWAVIHPVLEKYGWRYQNCNVWNKGKAHIAGNVNTKKIRRFPVVTELCVQYSFEARLDNKPLKKWLRDEWRRTGLPLRLANEACGVADAAVRKYLDQGHLWYYPPPEMFERLQRFANSRGKPDGRPYFTIVNGKPGTREQWARMRSKFSCPHGFTNVWDRAPLNGSERLKAPNGKAVHLNQKPLDVMKMLVATASDQGDVIWEPFGGLFTASLAAQESNRRSYAAELDPTYFKYGLSRFTATEQRLFPSL